MCISIPLRFHPLPFFFSAKGSLSGGSRKAGEKRGEGKAVSGGNSPVGVRCADTPSHLVVFALVPMRYRAHTRAPPPMRKTPFVSYIKERESQKEKEAEEVYSIQLGRGGTTRQQYGGASPTLHTGAREDQKRHRQEHLRAPATAAATGSPTDTKTTKSGRERWASRTPTSHSRVQNVGTSHWAPTLSRSEQGRGQPPPTAAKGWATEKRRCTSV